MKEVRPSINEVILMAGISDMHNCCACGELCGCGRYEPGDCSGCEDCVEWYFNHAYGKGSGGPANFSA